MVLTRLCNIISGVPVRRLSMPVLRNPDTLSCWPNRRDNDGTVADETMHILLLMFKRDKI